MKISKNISWEIFPKTIEIFLKIGYDGK